MKKRTPHEKAEQKIKKLVSDLETQLSDVFSRAKEQELLRLTVEHFPASICCVGDDARFVYVNDSASRALEFTSNEMLTMTVHDIAPDFPRKTWEAHWGEVKERGSFTLETRSRTKKGKIIPIEMIGNYLEFDGREYQCVFVRNISGRLKAEAALRDNEEKYRLLLENVGAGVTYLDAKLRVVFANSRVCGVWGMDLEALKRMTLYDMFPKKSEAQYYSQRFFNIAETGRGGDFEDLIDIRGEKRWTHSRIALVRDIAEKHIGYVHIAYDITERKQAEQALEENEERLGLALKATNDGIWDWHIPRDEVLFSPRLEELLGLGQNLGVPKSIDQWKDRIHPDHSARVINQLEEQLKGNALFNVEYLYRYKTGEYRWLNTRTIMTFDEAGKPQRMVGSTRDINVQKKAEELIRNLTHRLIKSQEIERRMISCELHDRVAQGLTYSRIECDILAEDALLPTNVRQRILAISEKLRTTLMTVQDLSHELRPQELEEQGLIRTLHEYCKDFSENNSVNVKFHFDGIENLNLSFDTKIHLYRLIQEGLNNIRKHADASRATVKLMYSFPDITLRIEDTGKGFNVRRCLAEELDEKRMGLINMEERARLLQGKMDLQSTLGEGTTISITIPYKDEQTLTEGIVP